MTIAEEIDIDRNDISDRTMFAEIGLDSLLAISILTRLREDTGQLLSSSFFNEHLKSEDIRQSLGEPPPQRETVSASPKRRSCEAGVLQKAELNPQGLKQRVDRNAASARDHLEPVICPTVHLQGIRSPRLALFLLPEGAGLPECTRQNLTSPRRLLFLVLTSYSTPIPTIVRSRLKQLYPVLYVPSVLSSRMAPTSSKAIRWAESMPTRHRDSFFPPGKPHRISS